jgi:hypothetical protein
MEQKMCRIEGGGVGRGKKVFKNGEKRCGMERKGKG